MRKLMYSVITDSNREFTTASYAEATKSGNRILGTFLVDIDETTEEAKEKMRAAAKRRTEARERA